ncbi:MAG: hypothetical protein KGL53_01425, partial [Elusimicrobia bacterium]|nr:hypothetical protein [Elusimicrobiota bacterium]
MSGAGTLYGVYFYDADGKGVDRFEVKASTVAGGAGPDQVAYTTVTASILAPSYTTPWALPAAFFAGLRDGATNYITVRAFDPAGNVSVSTDAFVVLKDTTPPAVVDSQAGDFTRRAASGTLYAVGATDAASGLAGFQYSVSTAAGSADASEVGWTDVPLGGATTGFSTPWSVDFASLRGDSTGYVSVRAWDRAGSTTTLKDAFFVIKDTGGPLVAITMPVSAYLSALSASSGTAADPAGVGGVEYAVATGGSYWDGAHFTSGTPVWFPASGGGAWSAALAVPWADGTSYRIVARATDTLGNYSISYATADFTFDAAAPTAGVSNPAPGSSVSSLASLAGTAQDPGSAASGLSAVEVRLVRLTDGLWWDWAASTWSAAAASTAPAAGTSWSVPVDEALRAALASGTSYFAAVRGVDKAVPANQGAFASGSTFTWTDVTPPAAVTDLSGISGPNSGQVTLSWSAPGDDGDSGLLLTGRYAVAYSSAGFPSFSTAAAQVQLSTGSVAPGAVQGLVVSGLLGGTTYHLRLFTADSDGNWSAVSNDAVAKAVEFPSDKIGGQVIDVSSQGITGVHLEAFDSGGARVTDGYSLADGSGTYTLSGLPTGVYKVQATYTANDITSSVWIDSVPVGTSGLQFVLQVHYTLSTLTGTLATLSAAGAAPAGFMVRAAQDGFTQSRVELLQGGSVVAQVRPDPTGRWTIGNLLPGKYSVRAFDGVDYTQAQAV